MSTKTTFKRVALVAVATLGLGVLTSAPSRADMITVTLTPSVTTAAITTSETATVQINVSAITALVTDSVTVNAVVTSANVATSGTLMFLGTTDSTTTKISAGGGSLITLDSHTATTTGVLVRGSVDLHLIKPTAAGTYTVYVYTTSVGAGLIKTKGVNDKEFNFTVTVTAPSTSADSSSTNRMVAGIWTALTDPVVDAVVSAPKSAASIVATIKVNQKNATSSANEAAVATITGPGFLASVTTDSTTAGGTNTNRIVSIAAPGVSGTSWIKVYSDGTAGVSTVLVRGATSGVVIASKTITFSDTKPASAAATVVKAFIAAGKTTTDVFAVIVKDASGNNITDGAATVTGTRSDTTTAGKAIATADIACPYNTVGKAYHCTVVGTSAAGFGLAGYTITATGTDGATPALSTKVTTTASTTFSDIVATKVTVTAPATASVGDKITYTLTATEKNGFPVADTTYEGGAGNGSVGGIFWNTTATAVPDYSSASVKPFNSGETITTKSGVATVDIFMPVAAGSVTATWTLAGSATAPVGAIDKSIGGTVVTVSTAIVNPGVDAATDAANEATDAANAATDAALAAADAADAATAAAQDAADAVAALSTRVSTLVSNLRKQITALTKLVQRLL